MNDAAVAPPVVPEVLTRYIGFLLSRMGTIAQKRFSTRLEALERSVPVGRLGQPAEVADLIVAVAQNAYMTAQTVSVDGGRYPR